jgi:hypothetical protein
MSQHPSMQSKSEGIEEHDTLHDEYIAMRVRGSIIKRISQKQSF